MLSQSIVRANGVLNGYSADEGPAGADGDRLDILVPRGGVRSFLVFNRLACPTFANRPIVS